jgi:hypothetical protein
MMARIVYLAPDHHELTNQVTAWRADYLHGLHPPLVELIALAEADLAMRERAGQENKATTLAIRMDSQVAMMLYEKLGELGRSMGWLPPISDARPA